MESLRSSLGLRRRRHTLGIKPAHGLSKDDCFGAESGWSGSGNSSAVSCRSLSAIWAKFALSAHDAISVIPDPSIASRNLPFIRVAVDGRGGVGRRLTEDGTCPSSVARMAAPMPRPAGGCWRGIKRVSPRPGGTAARPRVQSLESTRLRTAGLRAEQEHDRTEQRRNRRAEQDADFHAVLKRWIARKRKEPNEQTHGEADATKQ